MIRWILIAILIPVAIIGWNKPAKIEYRAPDTIHLQSRMELHGTHEWKEYYATKSPFAADVYEMNDDVCKMFKIRVW